MTLGFFSARIPARRAACMLLVVLCAADARAQKLSVQGDRFAVDGAPRFLTFISYFGGMGDVSFAPEVRRWPKREPKVI